MEKEDRYVHMSNNNKLRFYQLPKALVKFPQYQNLSSKALLLYAFFWDRTLLSISNGKVDDQQRVYCMYAREKMGKDLHCHARTTDRIVNELIKAKLLIKEKKNGDLNSYYVLLPDEVPVVNQVNSKESCTDVEKVTDEVKKCNKDMAQEQEQNMHSTSDNISQTSAENVTDTVKKRPMSNTPSFVEKPTVRETQRNTTGKPFRCALKKTTNGRIDKYCCNCWSINQCPFPFFGLLNNDYYSVTERKLNGVYVENEEENINTPLPEWYGETDETPIDLTNQEDAELLEKAYELQTKEHNDGL